MDKYYVEIVRYGDDKVVKRMGPHSERKADKIDSGANRTLNHDKFYTRVVQQLFKKKLCEKCTLNNDCWCQKKSQLYVNKCGMEIQLASETDYREKLKLGLVSSRE